MGVFDKDLPQTNPDAEPSLSGEWKYTVEEQDIVVENIPPQDIPELLAVFSVFNDSLSYPKNVPLEENLAKARRNYQESLKSLSSQEEFHIIFSSADTKLIVTRGSPWPPYNFVRFRCNVPRFFTEDTLAPFKETVAWLTSQHLNLAIKQLS